MIQVDFASTFLNTPGQFISIWSEVTTLTWSEVQSAAPIFFTMGGILALAVLSAGLGWRFDQKVTKGGTNSVRDKMSVGIYDILCGSISGLLEKLGGVGLLRICDRYPLQGNNLGPPQYDVFGISGVNHVCVTDVVVPCS